MRVQTWAAVAVLLTFIGASLRSAAPVSALTHSGGAITIADNTTATPYPSTINVQGEPGRITDIDVTLFDFTHAFPDDVDVMLVAPNGSTRVMLMSDACGSGDMLNVDLTFNDEAASLLSDGGPCTAGGYHPSDYGVGENMPAPAPTAPYSTLLSSFDNITPNGIWSLYVRDDLGLQAGDIASWQLSITTDTSIITMTSLVSAQATPYPYNTAVTGRNGLITDVNVTLSISHTFPDNLDILLRSPDGDTVVLMSDACGGDDLTSDSFTFDQSVASVIPDVDCNGSGGTFRPANHNGGDGDNSDWGLPGPHGTSLNDFNGENPNGTWSLFVYDDAAPNTGFIRSVTINITTTNTSIIQIPITSETDGSGTANPYPYNINIAGEVGVVSDVNVSINGFTHSEPNDVDMLLVSPNGIAVMLMSGACGLNPMTNIDLDFNDEIGSDPSATIPDVGPCTSGTYRPGNWDGTTALPSPAPSLPYFNRFSAFDGINPNGTWQLYINDDSASDAGFITGPVTVNVDTVTSLPNLVQNSGFASGETNWQEFGGGSGSVVSGAYQFQRTSGSDAFTIFQTMTPDFAAETEFELRFDMRNSGATQKRVTVVIWDAAFGRQRACSFWLDTSATLRTYQILGDVPDGTTWTDVTVHFYASSSPPAGNDGFYILDNVILRQRPDLPTQGSEILETLCIDPTAPTGDLGSSSANLLNNSTFAALPGGNANGTWALTGNISGNLSAGALRIQRTGDPAGSLLQDTNFVVNNDESLELSIDLGNSAAIHQRATILMHNENFDGLQFCTFWLPPNTPLGTYIMRTSANKAWNSQGVSVSVYPSTSSQYILVDNTILLRRDDMKVIGTGCYEPGSVQPALDDVWMQAQFDALAAMQPTLMPTATPFAAYSVPGMTGEQPIIATPSAPTEYTPPGEGSSSE